MYANLCSRLPGEIYFQRMFDDPKMLSTETFGNISQKILRERIILYNYQCLYLLCKRAGQIQCSGHLFPTLY